MKRIYTASSAEIKVCGEDVRLGNKQATSLKQKKDEDVNKTSCKLFRTVIPYNMLLTAKTLSKQLQTSFNATKRSGRQLWAF